MDDRPRVRQRHVERVRAAAHRGEELGEPREHGIGARRGEDSGRQVRRSHGRPHLRRPGLAREVRERPRLGERSGHAPARAREASGERHAAERPRRQQDDLALVDVGREPLRELVVARRGQRRDEDLGALDGLGEVGRRAVEAGAPLPPLGEQHEHRLVEERAERLLRPRP